VSVTYLSLCSSYIVADFLSPVTTLKCTPSAVLDNTESLSIVTQTQGEKAVGNVNEMFCHYRGHVLPKE